MKTLITGNLMNLRQRVLWKMLVKLIYQTGSVRKNNETWACAENSCHLFHQARVVWFWCISQLIKQKHWWKQCFSFTFPKSMTLLTTILFSLKYYKNIFQFYFYFLFFFIFIIYLRKGIKVTDWDWSHVNHITL